MEAQNAIVVDGFIDYIKRFTLNLFEGWNDYD